MGFIVFKLHIFQELWVPHEAWFVGIKWVGRGATFCSSSSWHTHTPVSREKKSIFFVSSNTIIIRGRGFVRGYTPVTSYPQAVTCNAYNAQVRRTNHHCCGSPKWSKNDNQTCIQLRTVFMLHMSTSRFGGRFKMFLTLKRVFVLQTFRTFVKSITYWSPPSWN